jgi:hypothetical protein
VNNAARFGRWAFIMFDSPYDIATPIRRLIAPRLPRLAA